jgi:hypothetical protein
MILVVYHHDQAIGDIQWSVESRKLININWVGINDQFQGKGYSYLLLIAMLALQSMKCGTIQLDDCTSRALTKNNVYYRLGFRIPSDQQLEQMVLLINQLNEYGGYTYPEDSIPTPVVKHKSLNDFLRNVKSKVPSNIDQLRYTLDGVDITTGMMRRFKALGYLPSRNSFGVNKIHKLLFYLKKHCL